MFTCQEIKAFVDTFIDEEFDTQEHAEVEIHLVHCEECRLLVEYRIHMKKLVTLSSQEVVPPTLRNRIFSSLDAEAARLPLYSEESSRSNQARTVANTESQTLDTSVAAVKHHTDAHNVANTNAQTIAANNQTKSDSITVPESSAQGRGFFSSLPSSYKKTGAAIFAIAALTLFVAFVPQWTVAPAVTEGLSVWEESVDWHRSDFPMEVHGPNQKDVSNWFKGKVNFNVEPLSFGNQSNTKLLGGRLASVHNQRAALLDYQVDGANVTVLIFDGKGITVPADKLHSFDKQKIAITEGPGYDVALFHKNDLTYTITTDLPSTKFENLIQQVLVSN